MKFLCVLQKCRLREKEEKKCVADKLQKGEKKRETERDTEVESAKK